MLFQIKIKIKIKTWPDVGSHFAPFLQRHSYLQSFPYLQLSYFFVKLSSYVVIIFFGVDIVTPGQLDL